MTPEWINQQIGFLNTKMGLYQVNAGSDFFFDPTPGFYGFICQGTTPALNEGMRMLANHVMAPTSPTIDPWEGSNDPLTTYDHDWTAQDGPPGMIRYDGPHRSRIQIAITNKHTPHLLGAILAHELTHHYLANRGVGYPETDENERLTDFATVFLGLGKLTLNGYNPIHWSVSRSDRTVTYTYQVGYLSARQIADAMCRVCAFRGIPLAHVESNLTQEALDLLHTSEQEIRRSDDERQRQELRRAKWQKRRNGLRKMFGLAPKAKSKRAKTPTTGVETATTPDTEPKRTVKCSSCGQRLRVPQTEQPLRVTCPKCKKEFVVRTRLTKGF